MPVERAPRVELLGPTHDRGTFSCGSPPLDRYLREQATQDVRRDVARVFVAMGDAPRSIAGFYTLSAASVRRVHLPEDVARRLPPHEELPSILLGRLAVDAHHQGTGLGEYLLADALVRVARLAEEVGVVAIVVDAIDDRARRFYERHGFRACPGTERRLFLRLKTVQESLLARG